MKIQLDTVNKTIKIEESARIEELLKVLKKILPDDWKKYTLETNVTINNWGNPIIIEKWSHPYPWWSGTTYCSNTLNTCAANVYNLEA